MKPVKPTLRQTYGWVIVPTGVTPRFNEFWERTMFLFKTVNAGFGRFTCPDNGLNRNMGIAEGLASPNKPEWYYFLDDDHKFSETSLIRKLDILDQRNDIDVLGSFYLAKSPPFGPVLYSTLPPDKMYRVRWQVLAAAMNARQKTIKVAACGAGGLLVRRRVIEALGESDWFETGPKRAWGPDVGFCMKLRDAGLKLHADLTEPIGHMVPAALTPRWNGKEWMVTFEFGGKSFALPVSVFAPIPDGNAEP